MTTQLEQQASEARALLADLASIGTDLDEEGVELVVQETDLAAAVAAAIAELIQALESRRLRQLAREGRIRDRIAQALGSLGLRKLVTPAGTVTLTASPARVIVTDESDIPDCWYHEKVVRTLDKAGIRKALQEGVRVGGCELSNRPDTIRIRT